MILAVIGLVAFGILLAFFYRTVRLDIGGSIMAALLTSGLLGVLIGAIVYAGALFG
jgi:hypothetical protein